MTRKRWNRTIFFRCRGQRRVREVSDVHCSATMKGHANSTRWSGVAFDKAMLIAVLDMSPRLIARQRQRQTLSRSSAFPINNDLKAIDDDRRARMAREQNLTCRRHLAAIEVRSRWRRTARWRA